MSNATPGGAQPRTVRCPNCGEPSAYVPENRYRPFCSQRCKLQDLGAWASESFRMDAEDGAADRPAGQMVDRDD